MICLTLNMCITWTVLFDRLATCTLRSLVDYVLLIFPSYLANAGIRELGICYLYPVDALQCLLTVLFV